MSLGTVSLYLLDLLDILGSGVKSGLFMHYDTHKNFQL